MICAKCKHDLKENAQFCGNCGSVSSYELDIKSGEKLIKVSSIIGISLSVLMIFYIPLMFRWSTMICDCEILCHNLSDCPNPLDTFGLSQWIMLISYMYSFPVFILALISLKSHEKFKLLRVLCIIMIIVSFFNPFILTLSILILNGIKKLNIAKNSLIFSSEKTE